MPINTRMNVLIVDDFQNMRRTIADIMRHLGFSSLHFAENGRIAWDKIQKNEFGLILLDWNMPVMSGLELLKIVRDSEEHSKLPILMVTAEAELKNVKDAIEAGVTNYVVKPFPPKVLMQKLEQIFGDKLDLPSEQKSLAHTASKGGARKPLSR